MIGAEVFAKDFTKPKKNLSFRQIGEERERKIRQAQDDGSLSRVKNRIELGELIGIPKNKIAVSSTWINRQIKKGRLTETLRKFDEYSKRAEYEYHFFPDVTTKNTASQKEPDNKKPETVIVKNQPAQNIPVHQTSKEVQSNIEIPLDEQVLGNGISLTLNINIVFKKG